MSSVIAPWGWRQPSESTRRPNALPWPDAVGEELIRQSEAETETFVARTGALESPEVPQPYGRGTIVAGKDSRFFST